MTEERSEKPFAEGGEASTCDSASADEPVTANEAPSAEDVLRETADRLRRALRDTADLQLRYFHYRTEPFLVAFLDTICDPEKVGDMQRLLLEPSDASLPDRLASMNGIAAEGIDEVAKGLRQGKFAVVGAKRQTVYLAQGEASHARAIQEPASEKLLQGSHVGFVEELSTNLYLVRKGLPVEDLTVRYYKLGVLEQKFAVVYREKRASEVSLAELDRRLRAIPDDVPLNAGLLNDWIEDEKWTLFAQTLKTERPDRVIGQLYRGRIAIFMESSPLALVVPITFIELFHTTDDYNLRWITATMIRLLRYFAFLIALTAPGLYIAVVSYHFEIIPSDLILKVKSAMDGMPYPPLMEALIMSVTIELIVEAGLRMPTGIGQIIGIVGGLVIGDAVVQAGLISNLMIITIALTTVSAFLVPNNEMNNAVRLLRFTFTFAASVLGFYGLMLLFLFMVAHMCRLTSLDEPYFSLGRLFDPKRASSAFVRSHATDGTKRGTGS